jgi:hypothetical protein
MNTQQIEQLIEQMSVEELQTILETQYPEELEKQAEAAIATEELGQVLYAYGAVMADREYAGFGGDLSKEASEQLGQAETEIEGLVNTYVDALGLAHIADQVELHKEAQAAAGIILEGYLDQLEKIAMETGKHGGKRDILGAGGAALEKVKGGVGKVVEMAKAHPGKAGLVGAGAAGLAALGYHMGKKRKEKESEMGKTASVDDLAGEVITRIAELQEIEAGLDKLAGQGMEKAKEIAKKIGKHPATAGVAGLGAGAAAMRAYMKRKEKKGE